MKDWFNSLFSDSDSVSFKRFIGFLAFLCIALAFYQSLYNDKMIADNLLYVMASIVGAAVGGGVIEKSFKYFRKAKEEKKKIEEENESPK